MKRGNPGGMEQEKKGHVDWEKTSNTQEELRQIREMEDKGEFQVEETSRGKTKVVDYGPIETRGDYVEPEAPSVRLPRKESGTIAGDRESGNFEYCPNREAAQTKMAEYGQNSVKYTGGEPDFSPFTTHETQWGTVDCQVEIGHMTGVRKGTQSEPGNYDQADETLGKKISEETGQRVTADQVRDFRESNRLTWHETKDGSTMQLVPTEIHASCAHTGGTAEKKYEQKMGDVTYDPEVSESTAEEMAVSEEFFESADGLVGETESAAEETAESGAFSESVESMDGETESAGRESSFSESVEAAEDYSQSSGVQQESTQSSGETMSASSGSSVSSGASMGSAQSSDGYSQ